MSTREATIKELTPDNKNANQGTVRGAGMLEDSLRKFGAGRSILIDKSGRVIAGNKTLEQAASLGMDDILIVQSDGKKLIAVQRTDLDLLTDATAKELAIADNRTSELSLHWDADILKQMEGEIDLTQFWKPEELSALLGSVGGGISEAEGRKTLAERFLIPPFSVLDARQGYWQDRKRAWLALGIQSELGRGANLQSLSEQNEQYMYDKKNYTDQVSPGGSPRPAMDYGNQDRGDGAGKRMKRSGRPAAANLNEDLMRNPSLQPGQRTKMGGGHEIVVQEGKSRFAGGLSDGLHKLRESQKADKAEEAGETASLKTGLTFGTTIHPYDGQGKKAGQETASIPDALVIGATPDAYRAAGEEGNLTTGTSIFDPVLCEVAMRWFCPTGGTVLDPFAGGSVRGIVASELGLKYIGIDLREEQLAANRTQALTICKKAQPEWRCGDSVNMTELVPETEVDFVFSCPPYADLEVYSEDPKDISTMDYPEFLKAYRAIIAQAVARLRADRFACFVVGDVRDKKGYYRRFVSDTEQAFQDAGAFLYNEAILVTVAGSLPIRIGKMFPHYRKLGKTHQNVLVFYKGDTKKIKENFPDTIEFADPGAKDGDDSDPASKYGQVM
jgi:DNA modification methylase